MARAAKILRRTIHTFLQSYHHFASGVAALVFPVSASVLLSEALLSSHFLETIQLRIHSLFEAAGFPASAEFFEAINFKFSQTMFSYVFTLPFALTFLVLAKASVVHIVCLYPQYRNFSSSFRLYRSLLQTQICNSFTILSANAAIFSLLFIVFNAADILHITSPATTLVLSTAGAIFYSIVLAHVMVACNLANVVSGVENSGGYLPLLKAFLLVRGRAATALSLALIGNMGMAAVEALFQYRVMKPYRMSNRLNASFICEAIFIAYIHSLTVVLDVIASCMFFKSCELSCLPSWDVHERHPKLLEKEDANDALASSKCRGLP